MALRRFPDGFLWGASTASYQVEGGNAGSALWDWEARKGWERSGDAARSWDLFEDDLALLKRLNANAYRFSLEWSRVHTGPGLFDLAALDRYASWLSKLSDAGIRPLVCLHHFSEPAWLLKAHPRGWLEKGFSSAFAEYAETVGGALGRLCRDWVIFNEPNLFALNGYAAGVFPPGRRGLVHPGGVVDAQVLPALGTAHRDAARRLRRRSPGCRIGVAQHLVELQPARPGDERAVERWDAFLNRRFLDLTAPDLDFIGVNYYTRVFVATPPLPARWIFPFGVLPGHAEVEKAMGPLAFKLARGRRDPGPRTGMGWELEPRGLHRLLVSLWRRYKKPLLVTENGMAEAPGVSRDAFLRAHLEAVHDAFSEGVSVEGYLHWSLLDNYEWGSYAPRFGLFTRDRRPAEGAELFARIAAANALPARPDKS